MKKSINTFKLHLVALTALVLFSVSTYAQSISGASSACVGSSVTYSASPSGGTWTSSNASVATVNGTTGVVTGVTSGTATITYNKPGTNLTKAITVNALPVLATSNTSPVCAGSSVNLNANTAATGTICGTASENGTITMTAPAGCVFTSINFASYGTPNGSCGSFSIGGCDASSSMSVVSGYLIGQNSVTISASNGVFGDPCVGTLKRLYIQATYAPAATYSWSGPLSFTSTSAVPSILSTSTGASGVYTVTATTAAGCTATGTTTVTVNPMPTVGAGSNIAICSGSSTGLTASGATSYSWTPSTGLSSNSIASPIASPTATTIYTVTGSYASGCSNSSSVTVTVNPMPSVAPSNSSPVCSGGNVNFSANAGASGTICGTATEGGSIVMTAPAGCVFTAINFASYGTPNGTCGAFTTGGCNASNSVSIVSSYLLGQNTATVNATNAVFGDPCSGTLKRLYIQASYTQTSTNYSWSGPSAFTSTSATPLISSISGSAAGTYSVTATTTAGCSVTGTTIVTVNALPAVGAGAGAGICLGSSTSVTATGASTYTWSPSSGLSATTGATVTANPSSNTVYTITGVAATGCTNTATKAVTVNSIPVITAGAGVSVCNGSSVTLSASGGATYSWSPASGLSATTGSSVNASPTISCIYTITGTSAAGCIATSTKGVTVNSIPNVSVGSVAAICPGASTSTITASGASNYSWAPTSGLSTTTAAGVVASPATTTNYTVTGTDGNSCINSANVTVTVNSLPVVDAGAGVSICTGASTAFSASGAATYSWAPATALSATTGALITASPAATTTYTVTGTSAAGCVAAATKTVTVSLLAVSAGSGVDICNGMATTLGATGGVNYSWSPYTGLSATTGASISASPSATTTYTVTVNNGAGCSNTATVMVSVNALPTIAVSPSTTICNGSSTTLSASGATSYSWSPATSLSATTGSTVSASPSTSNTYTVTGYSSTGCFSTATLPVSVNALPTVTSVSNGGVICAGNTLSLLSSATPVAGSISYSWAGPNSFTSTIQNPSLPAAATIASGVYTMTATDGSGCSASAVTTATVNPTANAGTITGANGVCIGSTIALSNTATGVWSVNNSIATIGTASGVVTGVSMGSVVVTYSATNAYSCNSATTKVINVNGLPQYIYTLAGTGANASTGDNGPSYLASLQGPRAMASDTLGNLYICDVVANIIRKISVDGMITTVAGNGTTGTAGDGGPATAAQLSMVGGGGICIDKAGNLFIVNTAVSTIRKVTASTGIISTIAGTGVAGYSGDGGAATAAKINVPLGICQDTAGNIYFADQGNYRIRKIAATTGIISTIIGTGSNSYYGDGGPGTAARVSVPRDVTADKSGNLYIVDNGNNVIRKYVIGTGIITTIAGNATAGSGGDGGMATAAQFNCPARIAFDGANGLYVADQLNNKIRQINLATGIITTVVANGTSGFSGDGGPSLSSKIWSPAGIAFNKKGNLFIADANNRRVRVAPLFRSISIALSGSTTLIAGSSVVLNATSSVVGSNVSYQWLKNGANVGTGGATYTNSTPASGDVYKCVLIVTPDCGSVYSDTSNSITITMAGARQNNTTSVTEDVENNVTIKTYPNPVHGQLTIEANGIENGTASISIMDQMGRVVLTSTTEVSNNQMSQQVDMETLATGMYLVSITDASGKSKVVKCVKN